MIALKRIQQIPKIRTFLPWITAAAVFLISYPWYLRPIHQTVQAFSQREHIDLLYQQRLDHLQQLTTKQKEQRESLLLRKQENDLLFFDPAEADRFFSSLDQAAVSFGCHVTSADYEILDMPGAGTNAQNPPVCLHGARVQLTGRYDRWIPFLEWIESLPQSVLIHSLRLESQKDRPGLLSGRIDLAVPVVTESTQPENGDLPHSKEN